MGRDLLRYEPSSFYSSDKYHPCRRLVCRYAVRVTRVTLFVTTRITDPLARPTFLAVPFCSWSNVLRCQISCLPVEVLLGGVSVRMGVLRLCPHSHVQVGRGISTRRASRKDSTVQSLPRLDAQSRTPGSPSPGSEPRRVIEVTTSEIMPPPRRDPPNVGCHVRPEQDH
jgi:hypothetical protein